MSDRMTVSAESSAQDSAKQEKKENNEQTAGKGKLQQKRKMPVFYKEPHEKSRIRHVVAVMSGKGGVGKSMITTMCALAMQQTGREAAILDADVTGPSIPHAFGLDGGLGASKWRSLRATHEKWYSGGFHEFAFAA